MFIVLIYIMAGKFELITYFAVILQTTIWEIIKSDPNTFGTKFVTLFPWSKKTSNNASLTFQIINASMNETAKVIIEYDNEKLKNKRQTPRDISTVKPNSYITHKFSARKVMMQLHDEKNESSIIGFTAARIYLSSSSPVSITECIFISHRIGDCFTVLPITMAGNRYSFSVTSLINSDIFTTYFIPTVTDSQITVATITRNGVKRISITSPFHRGSITYAYNSSIDGPSTVYVSSSSPFMVLLSMRTHLKQISSESFACTMLIPLPDDHLQSTYSQIALRDNFDIYFIPLDSSDDYRTQLFLAAPTENSQPFTVVAFRSNSTRLINVTPNVISDSTTSEWNYRPNDATVGYMSSGTPFQLLRFETYQNLDSFLDIVPAYSQYLTGRLCFIFRNENERLFLYDIPRQSDTLLLDGKALEVEYVQRFRNPFRYITMQKINTKNLKRGMHCLQSNGRYLLFIFGGSKQMYGYVPAFNAYPMERSKLIVENTSCSYHSNIFGVSFLTLFPWIAVQGEFDDSTTATTTAPSITTTTLTLDILNPHPYLTAQVNISYHSEAKRNLIQKVYNIAPYTNCKLEMNEKMTKLYATYSDSIYKSNSYDPRITIKSSIPISITQSHFFGNEIGDSFTVLPLKMASQKYSFLLPKLAANNNHIVVYFLPFNQTTKISTAAKFDGKEGFHEIKIEAGKNSPIFAYYGSARELSLNLTGDKPYEVIITVQRLLLTHITPSVQDRTDFDCTVTMPTMENTTTHTNIRSVSTPEETVSFIEEKPSEERMRMKAKKTFENLTNRERSAKTKKMKLSPKELVTIAGTNDDMQRRNISTSQNGISLARTVCATELQLIVLIEIMKLT